MLSRSRRRAAASAREQRARRIRVREQRRRGTTLHEAPEDLVERRRLLLDVIDAVRVRLAELGALRGVGDRVLIMETRPLSAGKRWRIVQILEKAK